VGENQEKLSLEELEEILEEARQTRFGTIRLKVGACKVKVRFPSRDESEEQGLEKDADRSSGELSKTESVANAAAKEPGVTIKAPRVGRFYSTSVSTSLPTIRVGDRIKRAQKICMIEAMGVEHELVAPCDCILEEVCVGDGDPVMYNQSLFKVKPIGEEAK
jgi:biotin carboxyl carrier protein